MDSMFKFYTVAMQLRILLAYLGTGQRNSKEWHRYLWCSADYAQRFWHHAIELVR
jgi:hypothetical protein